MPNLDHRRVAALLIIGEGMGLLAVVTERLVGARSPERYLVVR
jgi:hypothetical protein